MQKSFYFIVRDILGKRRNKHIEKRKKGYYLYMTYRISSWLSCNIFYCMDLYKDNFINFYKKYRHI